jgi:hypothetical protein
MQDVFGDEPALRPDEIWIPEVTRRGWVILMKDDKIRLKPLERAAVVQAGARVFCITNAQITGDEMAARLIAHRHKIIRLSRNPGPYVYGVYTDGLKRLFPRDPRPV